MKNFGRYFAKMCSFPLCMETFGTLCRSKSGVAGLQLLPSCMEHQKHHWIRFENIPNPIWYQSSVSDQYF